MAAFGKKEHKNADWFEACWEEIQPVTEAKRKAMLAHKQDPSPSTHDDLREARSKAQQTARHCAKEYWQNLCGMYKAIKTATSPTSAKTAPLKSKTGSEHVAAALGGVLSQALLNPEHRHRHCPQCPTWVASHRGAWQHTNIGRAQHSDQRSHLWQRNGEGRYLARRFEAWEANHPATTSWAPLSALGARSHPPRHERCQHSHPVQEQGWP